MSNLEKKATERYCQIYRWECYRLEIKDVAQVIHKIIEGGTNFQFFMISKCSKF